MNDLQDFVVKTSIGNIKFRILVLENGFIILISSSKKFRLGPTALATPPSLGRATPSSTAMFGSGQDLLMVRTIAERVATWTNQACMVMTTVSNPDRTLLVEIINALKDYFVT